MSPWPKRESGANRQIGETQRKILARAAASPSGQVIVEPASNADWCAAKRLTQRGLLTRHTFDGKRFGTIALYEITERGRTKLREVERG